MWKVVAWRWWILMLQLLTTSLRNICQKWCILKAKGCATWVFRPLLDLFLWFICCIIFSLSCKGFILQIDFFLFPYFFLNSALFLVLWFLLNGISLLVYLYKMISHFHKVFYQTKLSLLFEGIKFVLIVKKMQMLYCSATHVKDLLKLL